MVRRHAARRYRNPDQIDPGPVVVVGAGNSGRQSALELAATHEVALAAGTQAMQLPQRMFGRDLSWWLLRFRLLDKTTGSRLVRRMRARGDLVIGSPLAGLRDAGVDIRPRLTAANGGSITFADGSKDRPATVIWATGFRPDHTWIEIPEVATEGVIEHERGVSGVPGLTFIGLPWQHTRGSALLGFVKDDAAWLARHITAAAVADRARPGKPGDFADARRTPRAGR